MSGLIEGYEDFTGKLVKIRNIFLKRNNVMLVIQNDEKQIKVKFGKAGAKLLTIGQILTVGHIGKQLINIRPQSHSPFSKVVNKETHYCVICGRKVTQIECFDIQNIRRKPGECNHIDFDLDKADVDCPLCPFNQCR